MRKQSRAIYRDPDLDPATEPIRFWFFICQQCRQETRAAKLHGIPQLPRADPKRSRFFWNFEKHEIRDDEAKPYFGGRRLLALPTLYEVSPESASLYEQRMDHHFGVGPYWSPPSSPRSWTSFEQRESIHNEVSQAPEVTHHRDPTKNTWTVLIKGMRRDFHRDKNMEEVSSDSPVGWGSIS